jgi:plastocyanin
MHKKFLLLLSLISIFAVSCKKRPNACMEISETSVAVGAPVTFTSCSSNALSLAWYTTGPAGAPENYESSSDMVFTQTFSVPGTYEVRLYAYREFSFEGELSISIQEIVVN